MLKELKQLEIWHISNIWVEIAKKLLSKINWVEHYNESSENEGLRTEAGGDKTPTQSHGISAYQRERILGLNMQRYSESLLVIAKDMQTCGVSLSEIGQFVQFITQPADKPSSPKIIDPSVTESLSFQQTIDSIIS